MANINNIENIKTLQSWDVPVVIHRTNAQPIDNASYFTHISAAENYALSGATAYVGQQLFVLNTTLSTVDAYIIQDVDGNLKKLDVSQHTLQKTIVTYDDGSVKSFDWSGELTTENINNAKEYGSIVNVKIGNAITSIGYRAFYNCSDLTSVTIPDSVTHIGNSAFNGCRSLPSITLGNSVSSIGSSAFFYCYSLSNVIISDSVTSIGQQTFFGCSGLLNITIPNSVSSIEDYAFYDCSGLTSVKIGAGAISIGESIFYGCTNLSTEDCVVFEEKQLSDVMVMDNHYWGLQLSNITTWNNASQEWVNDKVYDLTSNGISAHEISSGYLKSNEISSYNLSSNNISSYDIKANNINVEDKLTVDDECFFGNSTTIHIGETNTLCTLLSNNFTPLSNAISSKIFTGTELCGNYTDLSVIKITKEEYDQKVVDAASTGVDLSDNVLYIISSDYIDAYEQRISNLVMTNDNTPSEATNKHYVDSITNELSNNLTGDINTISIQLSTELTTLISGVSSTISTELTTLISGVSSTISTELTTDICSISTDLSNAISSKIFTGTELCGGNYTDLSVIKITKEEYDQKVVDAAATGINLSDNVIYIVSSDYIDAYGQLISNLVMTDDGTPSEATNKHYVDNLSIHLSEDVSELIGQVSVQLSTQLYSTLSNTYQIVSALSDAVSSTANVGDIVVVSSYISLSGNQPISRTAYYWTGNEWGALDGNYDATNVYFSENLKYTNAIGALPAPSEGQGEINAAGLNLKNVLESILVKEKSGTKTNPSIITTNSTANVLYGTVLTPSYYFAFEDGNYQYGPDPTGSEVSSWKVKTNENELTLPTTATSANSISNSDAACNPAQLCATFSTKALNASIYQISAYVSYTEGDIPYTNTHNPDSQTSARITESYATKSLNLYNVYKPCFWKITTTPTANITSAAISSLSPSTGMNHWNVLSNGTWKTTYNCTSPWYEIFFLAPKGIANHSSWSGKDANNMTVKVEPAVDVEFTHENVGNDEYKLFIVRNADVYGATTVTMEFA